MFTRNPSAQPNSLAQSNPASLRPATPAVVSGAQRRTGPTESGDKSIIGNDLRIIGQGLRIISRSILQIDGEIEGDVQAAEVIVVAPLAYFQKHQRVGGAVANVVDTIGWRLWI